MMMNDTIRKERLYPDPPDRVWVALTDPHALAEWLMPNNFAPIVGHRFRFQVDPMAGCVTVTECEVLEVERPRRLVYSWLPLPIPNQTGPRPNPSVVSWTLKPESGGTRLLLEHSGLAGVFPWWQRFMFRFGWGTMIKRLIPKVMRNVEDGVFTPGAIPLHKRCYKTKTLPAELTR